MVSNSIRRASSNTGLIAVDERLSLFDVAQQGEEKPAVDPFQASFILWQAITLR